MYAVVINPIPLEVSVSAATGSALVKLGRTGSEVHLRFGTAGDAASFFLDTAMMLAAGFKEVADGEKVG